MATKLDKSMKGKAFLYGEESKIYLYCIDQKIDRHFPYRGISSRRDQVLFDNFSKNLNLIKRTETNKYEVLKEIFMKIFRGKFSSRAWDPFKT